MRYEVEVGPRTRQVDVHRTGGTFTVLVDGESRRVDAAPVDARTLSLIVEDRVRLKPYTTGTTEPASVASVASGISRTSVVSGISRTYEVTLAPDPASGDLLVYVGAIPVRVGLNSRRRWGRRDDAGAAGAGPDRITAPMPGKIVRVLVQTGEAVRARQPVVVVEAMKMENELRAGCDGTVTEIHAREGMSVDAGKLLIVISAGGQREAPESPRA